MEFNLDLKLKSILNNINRKVQIGKETYLEDVKNKTQTLFSPWNP